MKANTLAETNKEIYCLAQVIYFEARGEKLKGQIAVAQVTINRKNSVLFPDTICEVVYQTKPVCQYSWYCNKDSNYLPHDKEAILAKSLARTLLKVDIEDPTYGALFFHASNINPKWNNLEKTVEIGAHIFYRGG
jgi:spore germination cell wall hydrolase CwlJ-like protein